MTRPRPTPRATRPSSAPPLPQHPPDRTGERQLFAAVHAALRTLNSATDPCPPHSANAGAVTSEAVTSTRVAQYLRAVVALAPAGSGPYGEAVAAVSAACTDLDHGDLPGAYLALRAADTALRESATA